MDDQTTQTVKLHQACVCSITIKFSDGAFFKGFSYRCDEHATFMDKLNKLSISNINKHHHKTRDSYFIVCDMVKTSSWDCFFFNSILCDVVNIFLEYTMFFCTCVSSMCTQIEN